MEFDVKNTLQRILFKMRLYREIKLVSQSEAAEALGVGLRSYQRIEAGETICDIEFLLRFCHFFEINFDHLVSPSAPVPCKYQKMFKSEKEVLEFKSLDVLNRVNFFKIAEFFCAQNRPIDEIAQTSEFINFPEKLIIFNTQKKYFNNRVIERLKLNKSSGKTFSDCLDASGVVSILDNLQYHMPKFSIVEPTLLITPKNENQRFIGYNVHNFREENNTISMSMLIKHSI